MKVNLPAEVAIDPEVELRSASDGYFLQARLNVSLPGLERQVAQSIVDLAHQRVLTPKRPEETSTSRLT